NIDLIFFIFFTIIAITGILISYNANKLGDNVDFIDRFICISWPVSIKTLVIIIGVFIIYSIITRILAGGFDLSVDEGIINKKLDVYFNNHLIYIRIFTIIVEMFYYWRIRSHILKISCSNKENINL
ncbi:MAG: hypothetical protein OEV44_11980, partial [Spirochaetota bacterium]|nr:hypothetical protein [Spirochaetota bacterium]